MTVELDPSNYATKALNGAAGVDTSGSTAKSDFASLKAQASKIDVDKLKICSADLSNLSKLLDNETVYDKLLTNINAVDTKVSQISGLVSKI